MNPPGPRDVVPDDIDAPFWEACRDGVFLVHRCLTCERAYWPATSCVEHGIGNMRWEPASGRGEVHTWTVFHRAYDEDLAAKVPYVLAVVRLAEGPFFHCDLVDCAPGEVWAGMAVRVVFDRVDDRLVLPRFRPGEG